MPFRPHSPAPGERPSLPASEDACLAAICHGARALLDVSAAEISLRWPDGRHSTARDGARNGGTAPRLPAVVERGDACVAEVAVKLEDGLGVGTLTLFDPRPRQLSRRQADQLRSLAMAAGAHLSVMGHSKPEPLRAEASRYSALSHALPQMIWVMRATDGEAIYVNRRFEDFHGPIGPSAAARLSCHHPDDESSLTQAWESAKQGRTIEMEGRLRRHDGQYLWHKLVMIPVYSGDTIVEWIGTALDIDEIVQTHKKIEDATGLLRLAQTAAGAGVWEWMIGSNQLRLSSESACMHGITREPGTGGETGGYIAVDLRHWRKTIYPRDFIDLRTAAEAAIRDGGNFTAEFRVIVSSSPDGQVFRWMQTFGQVLRDAKTGLPDRLVGLSLEVTERKEAQDRIEHMALHDGLTGLPNRALFRDKLSAAFDGRGPFALLLCDLDGFKGVNDTLGHAAGDTLLQVIGSRLKAALRSVDTVARLGGDEFAVLLCGIGSSATVEAMARRMIDAVSFPVTIDGHDARVGISIGIATASEAVIEIGHLMREADAALYRAKAAGRNRYCFATCG